MARRLRLARPVKAASSEHGLNAFRARTAAASGKARQDHKVKTATARTTRFRIKAIKHSAAIERG